MNASALGPALRARLAVFVVSGRPRSGKTTVSTIAAEFLGVAPVISSHQVNGRIETRLGLKPGTIIAERAIDPERFRPELIAEANAMAAAGMSPGLLCVQAGSRVIDGMRRVSEVRESCTEARRRGLIPIVLFVENPHDATRVNDNTESFGLRSIADAVITNDASVDHLRSRTLAAIRHAAAVTAPQPKRAAPERRAK
jgi:hypothetical protein